MPAFGGFLPPKRCSDVSLKARVTAKSNTAIAGHSVRVWAPADTSKLEVWVPMSRGQEAGRDFSPCNPQHALMDSLSRHLKLCSIFNFSETNSGHRSLPLVTTSSSNLHFRTSRHIGSLP